MNHLRIGPHLAAGLMVAGVAASGGCMRPTSDIVWRCGVATKDGEAQSVTISWPRDRLRPSIQRYRLQSRDRVDSVWVTEDETLYATLEHALEHPVGRHLVRVYAGDGTLAGEYGPTELGLTAPTISEPGKCVAFLTAKKEVIVGTRKDDGSYVFEARICVPGPEPQFGIYGALCLFGAPTVLYVYTAHPAAPVYAVDLDAKLVWVVGGGRLIGTSNGAAVRWSGHKYTSELSGWDLAEEFDVTGPYASCQFLQNVPGGTVRHARGRGMGRDSCAAFDGKTYASGGTRSYAHDRFLVVRTCRGSVGAAMLLRRRIVTGGIVATLLFIAIVGGTLLFTRPDVGFVSARGMSRALSYYAVEHEGRLPPSFEALATEGYCRRNENNVWIVPRRGIEIGGSPAEYEPIVAPEWFDVAWNTRPDEVADDGTVPDRSTGQRRLLVRPARWSMVPGLQTRCRDMSLRIARQVLRN